MKKWLAVFYVFSVVAVYAQDNGTGIYACCRNSFLLKLLPAHRFEIVMTSFGADDRDTEGKVITGNVLISEASYRLAPDSVFSVKEVFDKALNETISVKSSRPVTAQDFIYLKKDADGILYWKRGTEWQKLYKQPADEQ